MICLKRINFCSLEKKLKKPEFNYNDYGQLPNTVKGLNISMKQVI